MKKILVLVTVFCLLLTGSVFAAPFLVCDPPPIGVDSYKVEITGPAVVTQDVLPDSTGIYGFTLDLTPMALPDGSYTVRVNASNMWGTSNWSTSYPFDKSAAGVPANIRLVPSLQ